MTLSVAVIVSVDVIILKTSIRSPSEILIKTVLLKKVDVSDFYSYVEQQISGQ